MDPTLYSWEQPDDPRDNQFEIDGATVMIVGEANPGETAIRLEEALRLLEVIDPKLSSDISIASIKCGLRRKN